MGIGNLVLAILWEMFERGCTILCVVHDAGGKITNTIRFKQDLKTRLDHQKNCPGHSKVTCNRTLD